MMSHSLCVDFLTGLVLSGVQGGSVAGSLDDGCGSVFGTILEWLKLSDTC